MRWASVMWWVRSAAAVSWRWLVGVVAALVLVAALPSPPIEAAPAGGQGPVSSSSFVSGSVVLPAISDDAKADLLAAFPECATSTAPPCPVMVAQQLVSDEAAAKIKEEAARWLPSQRWADAFGDFHDRLGAKVIDDVPQKTANGVAGLVFAGAQWLAGLRGKLVLWGVFTGGRVRDSAVAVDEIWAGLSEALFASGLLMIAFVAAAGAGVWRFAVKRGGTFRSAFKDLGVTVVLIGAFLGLMGAAEKTASSGSPATWSPSWITLSGMNALDQLASLPTQAIANFGSGSDLSGGMGGDTNCGLYEAALRDRFLEEAGVTGGGLDGAATAVIADDALTMQTLGATWGYAQFGDVGIGMKTRCVLLERFAGIPRAETAEVASEAGGSWPSLHPSIFGPYANNPRADRVFIAFAGCRSNGGAASAEDFWAPVVDKKTFAEYITALFALATSGLGEGEGDLGLALPSSANAWAASCQTFFDTGSTGTSVDESDFEFEDSVYQIQQRTSSSGAETAQRMLMSVHGEASTLSLVSAFGAFISQLILLFVIGMISLGCLIAAVALVVAVPVTGPLVMVWAAFPGKQDAVKKFWKSVAGMVAARALFVGSLAALSAVTSILYRVFPPDQDVWGAMTISLYVLAAAFALHQVLKKTGLPSVFTPKGALAVGLATVGGAAVVGSAFTGVRRARSQFRRSRVQNRKYKNMFGRAARRNRDGDGDGFRSGGFGGDGGVRAEKARVGLGGLGVGSIPATAAERRAAKAGRGTGAGDGRDGVLLSAPPAGAGDGGRRDRSGRRVVGGVETFGSREEAAAAWVAERERLAAGPGRPRLSTSRYSASDKAAGRRTGRTWGKRAVVGMAAAGLLTGGGLAVGALGVAAVTGMVGGRVAGRARHVVRRGRDVAGTAGRTAQWRLDRAHASGVSRGARRSWRGREVVRESLTAELAAAGSPRERAEIRARYDAVADGVAEEALVSHWDRVEQRDAANAAARAERGPAVRVGGRDRVAHYRGQRRQRSGADVGRAVRPGPLPAGTRPSVAAPVRPVPSGSPLPGPAPVAPTPGPAPVSAPAAPTVVPGPLPRGSRPVVGDPATRPAAPSRGGRTGSARVPRPDGSGRVPTPQVRGGRQFTRRDNRGGSGR